METAVCLFAQRLYSLRTARNMTQENLATKAKLHPGYISALERGTKIPSLVTLDQLAGGLGVQISALVDEEGGGDAKGPLKKEITLIVHLLERCDATLARRIRKAVECLTAP